MNNANAKVNIPDPPRFLTFLALLFVPGVYVVLLGSAAVVLAVGGGLIYLIIRLLIDMHRAQPRLMILAGLLGVGVVSGLVAVARGIIAALWKEPNLQPGIFLDRAKEHNLGHFIAHICSATGADIPDAVLLHMEPTFFVTQTKMVAFNGAAKGRILALGLPLLGGLTKCEIRAILAHEFAHFTGGDTLYSSVIYPVYAGAWTSCISMAESMDNTESFTQKLPMMLPLFALKVYLMVFDLLNMRLSRLRETRADAIAIATCGSRSFQLGLMKTAGMGGAFYDKSALEIARKTHSDPASASIYTAFRTALPKLNDIANAHYRHCLTESENKWDSHPALKSRLESAGNSPEKYNDNELAISLLENLDEYENALGKIYADVDAAATRVC
ncbi:MAG: M48 family metalloprotease [Armatimonadota bacterium]|nr:M48 family metalloprotease [bacterium]